MKEYNSFTQEEKNPVDSLNEIGNDVAVVYADGNNMGGIVNNIESLYEMMYFSRRTADAAKEATFKALHKVYGKSKKTLFEIIAVGGDDIFLFVSGKGSIQFAVELIELFNGAFRKLHIPQSEDAKYAATLSAGVCIARSNTPVRVMFQNAEDAMHRAKVISRSNQADGSVDFTVMDSFTGTDTRQKRYDETDEVIGLTLLPYSLRTARDMLELGGKMKSRLDEKNSKTNLFKIMQGIENVDSVVEGMLLYLYDQIPPAHKRGRGKGRYKCCSDDGK
jgi:CRISPR-associated protein Cmr2